MSIEYITFFRKRENIEVFCAARMMKRTKYQKEKIIHIWKLSYDSKLND
jgi:hypothetical protein